MKVLAAALGGLILLDVLWANSPKRRAEAWRLGTEIALAPLKGAVDTADLLAGREPRYTAELLASLGR